MKTFEELKNKKDHQSVTPQELVEHIVDDIRKSVPGDSMYETVKELTNKYYPSINPFDTFLGGRNTPPKDD